MFTHDLCSPIQGGQPLWDGSVPFTLHAVALDTSAAECAAGWNYTEDVVTGLYIAGLWPNGRPSRVFAVEASANAIERGNKRRASSLRIVAEIDAKEIASAICLYSRRFGDHAERMASEQIAWRQALTRPRSDPAATAAGLRIALATRELGWELQEYPAAWDTRERWTAWDARAAWAARGAWDALTVCYTSLAGWTILAPEYLTVGLRAAYENGLGLAMPVSPNVLGWAMMRTTR